MSRLPLFLDRLEGVHPSGRSHMARCPAHEDRSPSLRIRESDDGRILLFCLAGCETADIVAAIGLTLSDLFPPRPADSQTNHELKTHRRKLEQALEHERLVLLIAHNTTAPKSDDDRKRERLAETRIQKIRALLGETT